jgi:hypothetical protein
MILQLKTETSPGVFIYKPLDVFEDFEVTYNHQFEDYKSLAGRKIPYTNKFKIPTTPNNRVLCGLPIDANYPVSRDVDGKMFYSNGLIAFDFIASIEGQQIDVLQPYIEISVIDIISNALKELNKWKMSDFFEDVNNTQRRYVDLNTDVFVYGANNSTNMSLDEMFTFPFYNFNNKNVMFAYDPMRKLSQLQPTFTLWKLIENIFSFVGIDVQSDFLKLDNELYPGIKANELGLTLPMVPMTSDNYVWSSDCRFTGIGRTPLITQARLAGVPNQFPSSPSLTPQNFMVTDLSAQSMKFNYDRISDKYENTSPLTNAEFIAIRAEENNATAGSFCSTVDGKAKITLSNIASNTDDVFFHINQLNREVSPLNNDGIPVETDSVHVLYPNALMSGITVPDMDVRMVISDSMEPVTGYWYEQGWTNTGDSYNVNESVICGNAVYEGITYANAYLDPNAITNEYRGGLKFRVDFDTSTEMIVDLEANKKINITFIIVPKLNTTVTIDAEWYNWFQLSPSPTTFNIRTEITQGYIKHSFIDAEVSGWEDIEMVEAKYDWGVTPANDPQGVGYIFPVNIEMDFTEATMMPTGFTSGTYSSETIMNEAVIDMVESMKSVKDYKLIDVVKMISQRFNLKFYSTSDGVIHLDTNENRLSGVSYHIDHLTDTGVAVEFTDNEIGIVNIKDTNPSFYDVDFNRLDNNIVSDVKRDEVTMSFTSSIVNDKMFRDEYDDSAFGVLATGLSSNHFGVSDRKQESATALKPIFTFLQNEQNDLWFPINECSLSTYNYDDDFIEPQLDAAFYNSFRTVSFTTYLKAVSLHDTGFNLISFVDDKAPIEPRNLYMQTWFQNIMDRVNDESVILSPDLYVSEATLKYLMDFPTLLYKGEEWEYQGLNSYPLSNKRGGMTSVKLIKKKLWSRNGAPTMPLNHIADDSFYAIWDASTDDVAVTGYNIYLDGYFITTVTTLFYNYLGLTTGQSYYFGVSAIDADGNESEINWTNEVIASSDASVTPDAPIMTYSNITCDGVTMSWTEPYDNVGVVSYNIYDGATLLTNVANTVFSYDYTGYTGANSVSISVSALDAAGNESYRLGQSVIIPPCAGTITPPTNLSIYTVADTELYLSWDVSSDANVDFNKLTLNGTVQTATQVASDNTYTFTGLTPSTFYTLGVTYVDTGVGSSTETTITGATTAATPTYTLFSLSDSYTTEANACSSTDITYSFYHDGVGNDPAIGDEVRQNEFSVMPPNGWYKLIGTTSVIYLNNGTVTNKSLCS